MDIISIEDFKEIARDTYGDFTFRIGDHDFFFSMCGSEDYILAVYSDNRTKREEYRFESFDDLMDAKIIDGKCLNDFNEMEFDIG